MKLLKRLVLILCTTLLLYRFGDFQNVLAHQDIAFNWERITKEERVGLNAITHIGNTAVVVGAEGLVLTSTDEGNTWEKQAINTKDNLISIVSDGKKCVAATVTGHIFISPNGKHWNTEIVVSDNPVHFIKYVNNQFFMFCDNFTVYKSIDGVAWEIIETKGRNYEVADITYYNGEYVFGSEKTLVRTKDFVTFTEMANLPQELSVQCIGTEGKTLFIGNMYGVILKTDNYTQWKIHDGLEGAKYLSNFTKIKTYNNKAYILETSGVLRQGTRNSMLKTIKSVDYRYACIDFIKINDTFIVINGYGSIHKGRDTLEKVYGDNYMSREVTLANNQVFLYDRFDDIFTIENNEIKQLAHLNSGFKYMLYDDKNKEYLIKGPSRFSGRSMDGKTFIADQGGNAFATSAGVYFNDYACVTDIYNTYGLAYFDKGYKYIKKTRFKPTTLCVFEDQLIMGGKYGEASIIDKNMKAKPVNINHMHINKIRYVNGILVAFHGNAFSISKYGEKWSTVQLNIPVNIYDIAYGDGIYVLVGSNGFIATTDRITDNGVDTKWYKNNSPTKLTLRSIAFESEKFIIAGNNGVVLSSKEKINHGKVLDTKGIIVDQSIIRIFVDNQQITFSDQGPVIENGRTFVPIRAVSEAMGCNVKWDDNLKKVTLTKEGVKIELFINRDKARINNEEVVLDAPAKILGGRTMIPLRFIAEGFNANVTWEDFSRTVYIDEE